MYYNHKEDAQIQQLKQQIEAGKMKKVQAEIRVTSLQDQYKRTAQELKDLGINPSNADETIQKLEADIAKELSDIQALMPTM